jgi:hypothetical protein
LVRTAFRAAVERSVAVRRRAAERACLASARFEAAERLSRRSARLIAFERRMEGRFFALFLPLAMSCAAFRFVSAVVPRFAGSFTPARRAFERPIAIACSVDRAPCFPSRT